MVIENVIERVRPHFVDMGVDEQVLVHLQEAWERKVIESGVFMSPGELQNRLPQPTAVANIMNMVPIMMPMLHNATAIQAVQPQAPPHNPHSPLASVAPKTVWFLFNFWIGGEETKSRDAHGHQRRRGWRQGGKKTVC